MAISPSSGVFPRSGILILEDDARKEESWPLNWVEDKVKDQIQGKSSLKRFRYSKLDTHIMAENFVL